jgi:hypothetical protein
MLKVNSGGTTLKVIKVLNLLYCVKVTDDNVGSMCSTEREERERKRKREIEKVRE